MEQQNYVVVTDLKMPFWSMVVFMVKWAIAAIPAILILVFIGSFFFAMIPSVIVGFTSHKPTSTTVKESSSVSLEECIRIGIDFMGPKHQEYIEALCKGDSSVSDRWKKAKK